MYVYMYIYIYIERERERDYVYPNSYLGPGAAARAGADKRVLG